MLEVVDISKQQGYKQYKDIKKNGSTCKGGNPV